MWRSVAVIAAGKYNRRTEFKFQPNLVCTLSHNQPWKRNEFIFKYLGRLLSSHRDWRNTTLILKFHNVLLVGLSTSPRKTYLRKSSSNIYNAVWLCSYSPQRNLLALRREGDTFLTNGKKYPRKTFPLYLKYKNKYNL